MKTPQLPSLISDEELHLIHGGMSQAVEIMWLVMGTRDIINYTADRIFNGCSTVAADDHTTLFFCYHLGLQNIFLDERKGNISEPDNARLQK